MIMWSNSNSLVVAYFAIIALLTGALVSVPPQTLSGILHIQPEFHGLALVAVVVFLGSLFNLLGAELTPIMVTGTLGAFVALTYNQDPLTRYLTLAAMLFSIGIYGMTVSRNAVRVLMSIELMLNAVNINLVAFARYIDPTAVKGQLFSIFILTVAAAEAAVGLAVVLAIYRNKATVDMEKFTLLKW
jgi:NAD(P)H-quinone oxidoreductase subunit 4L